MWIIFLKIWSKRIRKPYWIEFTTLKGVSNCLLKNQVQVACVHSMLKVWTHTKGEKTSILCQVFSKAHLWICFVDQVWRRLSVLKMFSCTVKLASDFVLFLSEYIAVLHRVVSEGTVKPRKLEEHSGLQLQCSIECMENKFELLLFIDMTLQGPIQQRNVQVLC